jgi:hypothetical protein
MFVETLGIILGGVNTVELCFSKGLCGKVWSQGWHCQDFKKWNSVGDIGLWGNEVVLMYKKSFGSTLGSCKKTVIKDQAHVLLSSLSIPSLRYNHWLVTTNTQAIAIHTVKWWSQEILQT